MKLAKLMLLLTCALGASVAALGQTVFYSDPTAWSQQLTTSPTLIVFPNTGQPFSAQLSSPFTVNGVSFADPPAALFMTSTCCFSFNNGVSAPLTITLPSPAYAVGFFVGNYQIGTGDNITITLDNGATENIFAPCTPGIPPSQALTGTCTFVGAVSTVGFSKISITDDGPYGAYGGDGGLFPWLQNIEYAPVPFACTIPPAGTAIPGAPVSWNKFSAVSPDVVWVNAHIGTPSGIPTTSVTTVAFTGVTLTVNNTNYALPNGTLQFDPSAPATPTTTFDSSKGWTTTVNPNYLNDEIFFAGQALPVDSNLTGGGKATLSFTTQSTVNSLAFSWQWSAAAYSLWPDNTQAGILAYHDGLKAGSPLNTQVQQALIQGPRGGGGSNYTGGWSGTGNGTCSN